MVVDEPMDPDPFAELSATAGPDGTVTIRPGDVAAAMNAIAQSENLAETDKPFTTPRSVGWLLKRQRFKRPPEDVFGTHDRGKPNVFRYRLAPRVEAALGARVKIPGEAMAGRDVELEFCRTPCDEMAPYERLLGDAMRGDATLFTRED